MSNRAAELLIRLTLCAVGVLPALLTPAAQDENKGDGRLTAKQIYESVKESVVQIETDGGTGTGFFFSDGKHVVTSLHVVAGSSRVSIKSVEGGTSWTPTLVCFSQATDLAVLALTEDSRRKPIPAGNSKSVEVADPVFIVGNPLGFLSGTLSTGIVSGKRNVAKVELIQTDATASPGSSGSPLLDAKGQVVGVLGFSLDEGKGLNLAVAGEYLNDLLKGKYEPITALKALGDAAEANPADERGTECFADLWGGITDQYLIWECESRVDRLSLRMSPTELGQRTFNRAMKLIEAVQAKQAFVDFIAGKSDAKKPVELLEAMPARVARVAGALGVFDTVLATATKKELFPVAAKEMQLAWEELYSAVFDLQLWAMDQPWFKAQAFEPRLSAPVLAFAYGPNLADIHPDGLQKDACAVGWVTGKESALKIGDCIRGLGLTANGPFVKVVDWRELNAALAAVEGKPECVYLQVQRKGKTEIVKSKVIWAKE